ncbi:MAG: hypothetical protein GX361_03810 [Bacteroidales bacterium]|nr:hypothetical protein [Bacteroidales bacterium]
MEKQFKVSKQTADFIECIKNIDDTCEQIYKTVSEYVEDSKVDEVMNECFYPVITNLKDEVFHYVLSSIDENLSLNKNKGVII